MKKINQWKLFFNSNGIDSHQLLLIKNILIKSKVILIFLLFFEKINKLIKNIRL